MSIAKMDYKHFEIYATRVLIISERTGEVITGDR